MIYHKDFKMIKKLTNNVIEYIFERVRLKFKNISDEDLYSTIWKKVKGSSQNKLFEEIDNIEDYECQCELCTSQDDDIRFGVKERFSPNPQTPFSTARTIGRRIRRDRNETQLFDVN